MKMKKNLSDLWNAHRMLLILTSCIILLQTVIGLALWNQLPEQIATHFGMNNKPDGWSSRAFTVFGMPLVLLFLHWVSILLSCTPGHMLRNTSARVRRMVILIVPATSLLMTVLVYGYALGAPFDIGRIVWAFVGVIFAVTGNYLPKMRRNPTMGIKLPWTLHNEENWNRTHRMAGPVWVLGGLLLLICALIGCGPAIPIAAIAAVIVIPTAYSFILDRRMKRA